MSHFKVRKAWFTRCPSKRPMIKPKIETRSTLAETVWETYSMIINITSPTTAAILPAIKAALIDTDRKYNEENKTEVIRNRILKNMIIINPLK